MSQYPPNPNQPPQQPGYGAPGTPPGGYPPPGVGYAAPGTYGAPQGSNAWGITSLITGIVGFCIPFVGGGLAFLFGLIGIFRGRKVKRGTGLSVVGLILGILSLGMWLLFSGTIFAAIGMTKANRTAATAFIQDLGAGNISSAQSRTDGSISTTQLQAWSDELKSYGTVSDVTTPATNVVNDQADLTGLVSFGTKPAQPYSMHQVKSGGEWKVTKFTLGSTFGTPGPTSSPSSGTGTGSGTSSGNDSSSGAGTTSGSNSKSGAGSSDQ